MNLYESYPSELYHYGVKGMKWGVRKAQEAGNELDRKKAAYKTAKKEYNKAYNKAHNRAFAAFSPIKKHRDANDKRWEDAVDKAEKANTAKKDYKEAKKEFNKNTTVAQKVGRALNSEHVKKGNEIAGKLLTASIVDDIFWGGAGKRAIGGAVKAAGRAATEAWLYSHGSTSVTWLD